MSGAVKSGLIFALVGGVGMIASTIVPALLHPALGLCLCGPLSILLTGGGAGFLGVRWSSDNAGVGQGVLAGAIAGVGMLIGSVGLLVGLLFLIRSIAQADPQMYEQVLRNAIQQQPGADVDPAALDQAINLGMPIAGVCLGILALLLSLGFGALGGWLAVRNRPQPGSAPVVAAPLGPPPLDPPS
jgi:hypothetical protein